MKYFKNNNQIHFLFFFILSLNYTIPIFFFGSPTLFYIDSLDSELVYNEILGKILKGNFDLGKNLFKWRDQPLVFKKIVTSV